MTEAYIAVVVVNYRTSTLVHGLLESLDLLPGASAVRVCVVDNSCDPDEFASLIAVADHPRQFASLDVIDAGANLGYGRGNNLGWSFLESLHGAPAVTVVLNPDVTVVSADFAALLTVAGHDDVVYVGLTPSGEATGLKRLRRWSGRSSDHAGTTGLGRHLIYPSGHCLVIPSAVWAVTRGFSDSYFLYSEEIDLMLRLERAIRGGRACVSDSLVVKHSGGAATGSSSSRKSLVTLQEATRSRVVLFRQHARLRPYLVPLILSRVVFAIISIRKGTAATRAVMRGLVGGIRQDLSTGRAAATDASI